MVSEASTGVVSYGLSVERLEPTPPEAIPLVLGDTVTGAVNPPTAQDSFTFDGITTGTYEITTSLASGSPSNVCMNVYQPNGTSVYGACTCQGCFPVSSSSVQTDVTPTQDGTYLVVVDAAGNDGISDYDLDVACLLGTCQKGKTKCLLEDTPSYDSSTGTLTMNFTVGTPYQATWNGWLSYGSVTELLWSQAQAITEPPVTVVKTQTKVPKSGTVGILSTLTTAKSGITCSSWDLINTGTP